MKYAAIIFIMIFCTAMGRYLSRRLSQRIIILEQINSMLNTIKTQLEYSNIPLSEMLEKLSVNQGLKKLGFIDDCIRKCKEGKMFPDAWHGSVKECFNLYSLNKHDKEILYDLGNVLGTTDLNGQLNICNFYISQIIDRQNDAKQRFQSYGKLYSAMGVLFGATIAILIF